MITRDNIKDIVAMIEADYKVEIEAGILFSRHDYVTVELLTANVGSTVRVTPVDYNDELRQKMYDNGDVFIDEEDFMAIYNTHKTPLVENNSKWDKLQQVFRDMVEGNGVTVNGYKASSTIEEFNSAQFDIIFEDESMMEIISGNIADSIYFKLEADLKELGYEIVDTDGTTMTLRVI